MTRKVFALSTDQTIDGAMWSFSQNEISGAPVRDPEGNLVGVLSKSDLVDPMRAELHASTTVADAMTPAVWAVHPDDPIMVAVDLMVAKGIHRVLVVRGPGQLEGIVTSMSVMRALSDGRLQPTGVDRAAGAHDVAAQARRERLRDRHEPG